MQGCELVKKSPNEFYSTFKTEMLSADFRWSGRVSFEGGGGSDTTSPRCHSVIVKPADWQHWQQLFTLSRGPMASSPTNKLLQLFVCALLWFILGKLLATRELFADNAYIYVKRSVMEILMYLIFLVIVSVGKFSYIDNSSQFAGVISRHVV